MLWHFRLIRITLVFFYTNINLFGPCSKGKHCETKGSQGTSMDWIIKCAHVGNVSVTEPLWHFPLIGLPQYYCSLILISLVLVANLGPGQAPIEADHHPAGPGPILRLDADEPGPVQPVQRPRCLESLGACPLKVRLGSLLVCGLLTIQRLWCSEQERMPRLPNCQHDNTDVR